MVVMEAFGRPLEDLALDHPRVGTQSTRRVETLREGVHGKDPDKFGFSCSYWGENRPLRQSAGRYVVQRQRIFDLGHVPNALLYQP